MARFVFTYDGEEFPLDANKLTFAEGDAIERFTGTRMKQWNEDLNEGRSRSLQALIGVAIKRRRPTFTFPQLDHIAVSDIDVERLTEDDDAEAGADETSQDGEQDGGDPLPPAAAGESATPTPA